MPRGKKALAEQITPYAASVEVRPCTELSRCAHDTSRIACVFKGCSLFPHAHSRPRDGCDALQPWSGQGLYFFAWYSWFAWFAWFMDQTFAVDPSQQRR